MTVYESIVAFASESHGAMCEALVRACFSSAELELCTLAHECIHSTATSPVANHDIRGASIIGLWLVIPLCKGLCSEAPRLRRVVAAALLQRGVDCSVQLASHAFHAPH